MLLFDDSKKLEKALGTEAAAVLAHIFERADEKSRRELATKADIKILHENMTTKAELAAAKTDILRWMVGGFLAQTALLVAILAFLR